MVVMEPSAGTPNFNQAPRQGGNFEVNANQLPQYNVDNSSTFNTGYNQLNQAPLQAEQLAIAEQLAQPSQAVPIAQTPQPTSQPVAASLPVTPTKPIDADQLEKVWVGRAQQAISDHKDDPYELAHQVAMLMQGYLRERYGKIVGKPKG